jgi:inner membrane protein
LDPISHALVGLAAGSFSGSGGVLSNPLALGCLVGSVLPDSDIIMQYWGDYAYLKNHRGASHSLVGMAALSTAASLLIHLLFPGSGFFSILLWMYIGCLTHVGLDIFNTYGAKLFWPFLDKKIGTGLMLSFDPFLVAAATVVYWFNTANPLYSKLGIAAFAVYLLFRQYRKKRTQNSIIKTIDFPVVRLVLLPSMTNIFSWDFIAYGESEIVTGKSSMFAKKIVLRDRLNQSESWVRDLVMNTCPGLFFDEFTREYYISFEKLENGKMKATMTDLRYYVNNRYMHHATVQFDRELNPVEGWFHPYNMKRSARIPV